MSDQYQLHRGVYRHRKNLFRFSFLISQLIFCSMLLFYMMKKYEIGMQLIGFVKGF